MFYTYILSFADGKFYTGITNNLQRRIVEHQEKKCISTRHAAELIKVYYVSHSMRIRARFLEVIIKHKGAGSWLHMNAHKVHVVYQVTASNKFSIPVENSGNSV